MIYTPLQLLQHTILPCCLLNAAFCMQHTATLIIPMTFCNGANRLCKPLSGSLELATLTTLRETHSFSRLFPRDSLKATLGFCLRLFRVFRATVEKPWAAWKNCPLGIPSGCALGNSLRTVFPRCTLGFSTVCPRHNQRLTDIPTL